jgi:hypothetical protein
MDQLLQQAYLGAMSANYLYNRHRDRYRFLLNSYVGGKAYRDGSYLNRYMLEKDQDYNLRLDNTPLDNQCKSIVSLYISFLFRTEPQRELGLLGETPEVEQMLEDADLEGRDMNSFMREVSTWSQVFGHCWVSVVKPKTEAITRADELAQGVRPYLAVYSPLVVTDFEWLRQGNGHYKLTKIKYVEEINDTLSVVKEWTVDKITTTTINTKKGEANDYMEEVNELGEIPFVLVYAERSPVRGIGLSVIDDIADQQRAIYNELSEVEQSIRLDTHPSLAATEETDVGTGAGALIRLPENLDPNLKPYILEFSGAPVASIYESITQRHKMIEQMANVGSVRGTETREMSGIALEAEFQLLNARLSSLADNLELAEEQIWRWVAKYLGLPYDGTVKYPDSFMMRDTDRELRQLVEASNAVTEPLYKGALDAAIMDAVGVEIEAEDVIAEQLQAGGELTHVAEQYLALEVQEEQEEMAEEGLDEEYMDEETVNGCPIATQDVAVNLKNRQNAIDAAYYGPLDPNRPNQVFWMRLADKWSVPVEEAKMSRCGNCAAFNMTSAVKACIEQGLAAGGATGDEWDTVEAGDLGYCEAFDFKCASNRTCDAWISGGPIVD